MLKANSQDLEFDQTSLSQEWTVGILGGHIKKLVVSKQEKPWLLIGLSWLGLYVFGCRKVLSPTFTCYRGQQILIRDLYVQNKRDLSSFWGIGRTVSQCIQFSFHPNPCAYFHMKITGEDIYLSKHWFRVKRLKWANFWRSRSRNVWPKNVSIIF